MQNAFGAAIKRRRVLARIEAIARRLDADEAHALVFDKRIKQSHRVGAAADARDANVGQSAGLFQNLRARFLAGHRVKIAHHRRKRVRPDDAADNVMRVAHVGHPIAHRFVGGVFQGFRAARHGNDVGAQQFHAKHVERLAARVFFAHVNVATQTEQRGHGRRGDAVLTGARFGDEARFAHALRQQSLAQSVVDFVRAGVQQILALEENLRAAEMLRQAFGVVKRRRSPGVIAQQFGELRAKFRIGERIAISRFEFAERDHQSFGHELSAKRAEMSQIGGFDLSGDGLGNDFLRGVGRNIGNGNG